MSNVWTESKYLMKKMTEIMKKKNSDDFPSGGAHFNAKKVKKGQMKKM